MKVTGTNRGLGNIAIVDPDKGVGTTNVNTAGAMFDRNGNPISNGRGIQKWTRPTQNNTGSVAGNVVTPAQMLENIKNDLNKKEENSMKGLSSMGGFTGRGLVGAAGTNQPVLGGQPVGVNQATVSRPGTVVNPMTGVAGGPVVSNTVTLQPVVNQNTVVNTVGTVGNTSSVLRPGSKVAISGSTGGVNTGVTPIQINGVNNQVVPNSMATADQKLANAKRNAGKLLNRILEMSYNLTEQEEKYLIEMMDAIGMKETLMSAAGLGTSTPINAQVVLNAINEMQQLMVLNANLTSNNIDLANSIYSKLDTLTLETQAGGYNEADLINVMAELYASGMINPQDTSKPNLIFCFNTLKTQIERMLGGVQPNGVINNNYARNVATTPIVNTNVNTTMMNTSTNVNQPAGKMFNRPVNQIRNTFGTTTNNSLIQNRGLIGGNTVLNTTPTLGSGLVTTPRTFGSIQNNNAGLIQTPAGANMIRTPMGGGVVGGAGTMYAQNNASGLNFNRANQDMNYSTRGTMMNTNGGFNQPTVGGSMFANLGVRNNMNMVQNNAVVQRPALNTGMVNPGVQNNMVNVGMGQPTNPVMQYLNM